MSRKFRDISGQKFGRLEAIRLVGINKNKHRVWLFKCSCGNLIETTYWSAVSGNSKSCGCLRNESLVRISIKDTYIAHKWINKYDRKEGTRISALNNRISTRNTSGVKGVCWSKQRNMWMAQIGFQGKVMSLGGYHTIEEAAEARREAEYKYFSPILEKYAQK